MLGHAQPEVIQMVDIISISNLRHIDTNRYMFDFRIDLNDLDYLSVRGCHLVRHPATNVDSIYGPTRWTSTEREELIAMPGWLRVHLRRLVLAQIEADAPATNEAN